MRECTTEGCHNIHRARGLCATHYNRAAGNTHPKVTMTCDGCGVVVMKEASRRNRYANIYCNATCANAHRFQSVRASKVQVVVYTRRVKMYQRRIVAQKPTKRVFKSGQCEVCSAWFVCLYGSGTCSAQCQQRKYRDNHLELKQRRRARQRKAFVAPVYRARIFSRDNYTCQLCLLPLDMQAQSPDNHAPTIDHVIPLARGGTHQPGNVQAAHFICNAIKGDRADIEPTAMRAITAA